MNTPIAPLITALAAANDPDREAADADLAACVAAWFVKRTSTSEQAAAGVAGWEAHRAAGGWSWDRPESITPMLHVILGRVLRPNAGRTALMAVAA